MELASWKSTLLKPVSSVDTGVSNIPAMAFLMMDKGSSFFPFKLKRFIFEEKRYEGFERTFGDLLMMLETAGFLVGDKRLFLVGDLKMLFLLLKISTSLCICCFEEVLCVFGSASASASALSGASFISILKN